MNLFELPDLPVAEELTTPLLGSEKIRIERIVSTGQTSGWYDQPEAEFVALLSGRAELEYENGHVLPLRRGDTVFIPPHEKHRVRFTSANPPCVWLCVFF